jgi:hypothetical protein
MVAELLPSARVPPAGLTTHDDQSGCPALAGPASYVTNNKA